jgi:hypothetical protein
MVNDWTSFFPLLSQNFDVFVLNLKDIVLSINI